MITKKKKNIKFNEFFGHIWSFKDFIKIIDLWVKFLIGLLRLFSLNSYQLIISFQTAFNFCLSLFVLSELLDSPYAIVVGGGGRVGGGIGAFGSLLVSKMWLVITKQIGLLIMPVTCWYRSLSPPPLPSPPFCKSCLTPVSVSGDLQMWSAHLGFRSPSFLGPFHELRTLPWGAKCGGVLERRVFFLPYHRWSVSGRGTVVMANWETLQKSAYAQFCASWR